MKVTLEDITKVAVEGTPITHELVLPTEWIAYYDTYSEEWEDMYYDWFNRGALHSYNVVIDESCKAPHIRLKPDYDYSSALPFDDV